MTLDRLLAERAREHPDRPALILPRPVRGTSTTSYGELDHRVSAAASGLAQRGLGPGDRAALLVPPTADFFVLAFALLRLGAVPVLVDPGIGRKHLRTCLGESEPLAFIGIRKAHLARRVLRWAPSATILLTAGRELVDLEASAPPFSPQARELGAVAAIVFTSGSTGVPKGVEQTQEMLLAQTMLIAGLYDLGSHQVSLATFPPFALFGPPLGMTTVVPRMDATKPASVKPSRVVDAANDYGATVLFGSPALLDTVSRGAVGQSMPTVRRVISAGAPVPRATQRRVLAMLPAGAEVFTPYGATEALPVASIGSAELLDLPQGICVGRPVEGVDVCVIQIDDGPIPVLTDDLLVAPGETGEVVVRGPNVTVSYSGRPEADALAKTSWDGQIAHRMGDLASVDAEGRLWFAGRKSHRLETGTGPMYSVPCEEVFNAHASVKRAALVGLGSFGKQVPVMVLELEKGTTVTPVLTASLLALGAGSPLTRSISRLLFQDAFPVDIRHNSKIDRPALARWAAKQ